jgi:hypothetical protein
VAFKVKIGNKELGNEVCYKNMTLYIVETEEACHERVSSLRACRLRGQLVIGKFGTSCKTFFFHNIETRPEVLRYHYNSVSK